MEGRVFLLVLVLMQVPAPGRGAGGAVGARAVKRAQVRESRATPKNAQPLVVTPSGFNPLLVPLCHVSAPVFALASIAFLGLANGRMPDYITTTSLTQR